MAVNTNIYGNEDMWITVNPTNWGSNVPEEEKIKIANFTDLTPEELGNNPDPRKASALGCAAYKMSQDASWTINGDDGAFNKSVSFVGMAGNKCPYTSIKYFSNINNDQYTSNYPITQLESDTYDVVNFAFHNAATTLRNDYGNNKRFMDIYKSAQGGGGNGNAVKDWYVRWNPDPFLGNGPSSTYPNYLNSSVSDYAGSIRNQDINFVTQMPCRRVVLVPFITCSSGNDSSVGTYDLDTYLTTYKTTKPRIMSVSFSTYIIYTDSDAPTSSHKRQLKYFAMSLLQSSNKFSNHYVTIKDSNTREPAENLFYPYLLMSPYIPLGGALNNGHSLNNKPSGLSTQTWSSGTYDNSTWYSVMAVCDLGDMGWTNWSGNNTGETGRNEYLYCNADNLTADEIRESVRSGLACFGMFFTDSVANAETKQLDDAGMFLGTLVNGIGYGDYTEGTANREQPQFNWKAMNESDYDPSNPPTPPIVIPPSNPTTFNPVSLADGGLKRYVLDDTSMTNFGAELWNVIKTSNPDELIQNQTLTNFLTNNPLDCVVSIKRFPLADMRQGDQTNPMLGKVKIKNVIVYPFDSSSTILSCGTIKIPRFFNDFRDYLIQYELILPFCGTISLDSAAVTGNEIEVKYAIDYTTGTCTAWVLANTSDGKQVVIDSANGNCTIDIPLSGVQTATLTGQIYNANENLKTAKFNGIISGVTGAGSFIQDVKNRNIGGAIGTGAKIVNAVHDVKKMEWNIEHTEIPLKMVGASSGCNSFQIELVPRLTAYVPNVTSDYSESDYLHNVGAAVCDTTTIGNYSGYAEITNVDMSGFAATSTEKNMIATALAGGVYL